MKGKKLTSFLVATAVIVSMLSVNGFAAENEELDNGADTTQAMDVFETEIEEEQTETEHDSFEESVPLTVSEADQTTVATFSCQITYEQKSARNMLSMVNNLRTGSNAWYWDENNTTKVKKTNLSKYQYDLHTGTDCDAARRRDFVVF